MRLKRGARYAERISDVRDTEEYAMGRRWLRHSRDGRHKQPFQIYQWFGTFSIGGWSS